MHAPLSPALRVEWRAISALTPIVEQWRALAARALEPNVFYDPAFALAAAPVFGARCGAVLVWSAPGGWWACSRRKSPAGAKVRGRQRPGGAIPTPRLARRWSIATRPSR